MRIRVWACFLLGAMAYGAHAQLRLPALAAPVQALPQTLNQSLNQGLGQTGAALDAVIGARRALLDRLVRTNRRWLEKDPHGDPIVRAEVLAFAPSDAGLALALAQGFVVRRETSPTAADLRVVVYQTPASLSTREALQFLRDADPAGTYDYNHLYTGAGDAADATPASVSAAMTPVAGASAPVRVGLLDTGVDASHAAFAHTTIHPWGCADKPVPAAHGTAVASILSNHGSSDLYAADVYCGLPTGGALDGILGALGWMAVEQVAVINVSLVGPRNVLLERTVATLIGRGHLIVAAVGNDGPTAPPLYPAAYPDVVGVTGVDASHRVLIEAARGPQVMFAAPGAGFKAANESHGLTEVRGTSYAAPKVARLLAEHLVAPGRPDADAAVSALAKQAIRVGSRDRDSTYGFGLVGISD